MLGQVRESESESESENATEIEVMVGIEIERGIVNFIGTDIGKTL
jgi:hypothetical protein